MINLFGQGHVDYGLTGKPNSNPNVAASPVAPVGKSSVRQVINCVGANQLALLLSSQVVKNVGRYLITIGIGF